jgi:diguanylate cyclase (GGDEF)-like protein
MIKKQILILENNKKNFDVLNEIFVQEDFECIAVLDEEGVKALNMTEYDLILVNTHVSYITPEDLISCVHTDDAIKTPVIYLDNSKEHNKKYLQECFNLGISDYIKKPFDKDEIVSRVRYHYLQSHKMKEYKLRIDKLGHLATVDQLSKSSSKMHMLAILKHQVNHFKRYKVDTSVVYLSLLNVDKTSSIFGFEYGEKIISMFAKELKVLIRESDTLARWSGADFMILLTNTDRKSAGIVVQKLKAKLTHIEFMKDVKPELAFGITSFGESESVQDIVQKAKYALGKAKQQEYGKVFLN